MSALLASPCTHTVLGPREGLECAILPEALASARLRPPHPLAAGKVSGQHAANLARPRSSRRVGPYWMPLCVCTPAQICPLSMYVCMCPLSSAARRRDASEKTRNLGLPDPLSRSLVLVCALRIRVCVLTSPFTQKTVVWSSVQPYPAPAGSPTRDRLDPGCAISLSRGARRASPPRAGRPGSPAYVRRAISGRSRAARTWPPS